MTLAPTYACFGCVDFANNARTKAYIAWACRQGLFPGGRVPPTTWICDCSDDDTGFTDPITDSVCWYDPRVPESAEFLGVVIRKVTGLRTSTFKREVLSAIAGGSILGQPTEDGRQQVYEVVIYSTTREGQNYGIGWMRRLLEGEGSCVGGGTSCASCQGQLLTVRVSCPVRPVGAPVPLDRGLHSFASAGSIDGFSLLEDEYPMGAANCNIVRAGIFTIATESPDSYSTEPIASADTSGIAAFTALGNCMTDADLPSLSDVCCPICATGCDPLTTDPACDCFPPYLLEPETLDYVAPCFGDPLCRCIKALQISGLPAGYDATFRINLQSGWNPDDPIFQKYGQRNFVIRIYENPDGYPTPTDIDTYNALVNHYDPCAEMGVSWMPPGTELIIDGLSKRIWLIGNGKCVDHSERFFTISGQIFPLTAKCTDLIVTVEWDCINVQGDDAGNNVPASMSVDTYLGFKL